MTMTLPPSRMRRTIAAASIALALVCTSAAHAQSGNAAPAPYNPMATAYVVTSHATYDGARSLLRNAVARTDSVGTALVLAEIRTHDLGALSERIHHAESRCGGYFAFRTRAEAEAFLRNEQSAQAIRNTLLVDYTIDNQATVNPWLPQVQQSNLYNTISQLSAYQNRYYASPTGKTAAESIRNNWQALAAGRADVTTELIGCSNCSTQPSVVLTIQGNELAGEVVVLGGHLDSILSGGGGSNTQRAPGADDDASGIASLTEILRVAMSNGWRPKRTVKFMGYAAEEVGLRGSNAIAQSFKNAGVNVVGVLQLDMTNFKSGGAEDMQLVTDYSNAALKTFFTSLFDTYLAPMGITRGTYTCGYACSDHASWTSAGYPSAMMFEAGNNGAANPNIHTTSDTLASMGDSAQNSVKFAQFGLAFLGEMAKTSGAAPGNTPPAADFSYTVNGLTVAFTDTSSDSDGTIVSRQWNFGDGTTSTAANPGKTYAAAGSYSVSLTVTDDDGASHSKTVQVAVSAPGGTVLTKGVPATGLGAAAGASLNYTMQVPSGASNLTFTTSGGTGDADLYVKFGSAPTDTVFDCRPYRSGNAESCTFAAPSAGTYYLRLKGYSTFSGVSLLGDYSTGGGGGGTQTYTNTTDYPIADNASVDSPIPVSGRSGNAPANAQVGVNIVHTYIGDLKVDLVAPDGSLYNLHNRGGGSADNIVKTVTLDLSTEALNGEWKLRVSDHSRSDTGYVDSWNITF